MPRSFIRHGYVILFLDFFLFIWFLFIATRNRFVVKETLLLCYDRPPLVVGRLREERPEPPHVCSAGIFLLQLYVSSFFFLFCFSFVLLLLSTYNTREDTTEKETLCTIIFRHHVIFCAKFNVDSPIIISTSIVSYYNFLRFMYVYSVKLSTYTWYLLVVSSVYNTYRDL